MTLSSHGEGAPETASRFELPDVFETVVEVNGERYRVFGVCPEGDAQEAIERSHREAQAAEALISDTSIAEQFQLDPKRMKNVFELAALALGKLSKKED